MCYLKWFYLKWWSQPNNQRHFRNLSESFENNVPSWKRLLFILQLTPLPKWMVKNSEEWKSVTSQWHQFVVGCWVFLKSSYEQFFARSPGPVLWDHWIYDATQRHHKPLCVGSTPMAWHPLALTGLQKLHSTPKWAITSRYEPSWTRINQQDEKTSATNVCSMLGHMPYYRIK